MEFKVSFAITSVPVRQSCAVFHEPLFLWKEGQDGPSHKQELYPSHLPPKECLYQGVIGTMFLRHRAWGTDTFLLLRYN